MGENKKNYKLFRPINDKSKLYVNKIIKKDIAIYSMLVISVLFLMTTSSYAYLSTEVNTVQLENIVSSTIEGVELTNTQINIEGLTPTTETEVINSLPNCTSSDNKICSLYEFTVNNTNGEVAKNVTYSLTNINNTFSNLKFKLYKGTKESLTSSSTTLMNSEKLKPSDTTLSLTGLDSYIKSNTNLTYTIVFYVEKTENQEMYDALKEFNANILIDLKTSGYVGE